jgi:GT2 family glycosyltransferase
MTVFVILHYRAIESTENCVEGIKALLGDKHIIIVDNASPDGTGLALRKKYARDKLVTVLLNGENSGFARGNNVGIAYACRRLSPDFVVVLNDDVEIHQPDFCGRIGEIYAEHPFDLLGPDIISQVYGIHQSPKRLHGCTLRSVREKAAYVKRSQNPVLMYLSSGEKSSRLIWGHVQRRRRKKSGIDFSAPIEGVVLHGSCIIFSRRYLASHPEPFFPGTFMYYEMEILEWLCRREGAVTRYDPSISVLHHQNVATGLEYHSIVKRSKFVADCLLDSLHAAEKLILSCEKDEAAESSPARKLVPKSAFLAVKID